MSLTNTANEIAYLSGLFNCQVTDGSYTNPNGNTVSFHIIKGNGIPASQYINGAINTLDLINGSNKTDPNIGLYNTTLTSSDISENIKRKFVINKIPFANYDQIVDIGVGSQQIVFKVVFCGIQYQQAFRNFIQVLFNNTSGTNNSLGSLQHPFYGLINNVLPINIDNRYTADKLNYITFDVSFITSDIRHLSPTTIKDSALSTIGKYYTGISNAVTSITSYISTINILAKQTNNLLLSQKTNSYLVDINKTILSQTAFFYQKIKQNVFNNNTLNNYAIDYSLLVPNSQYIINLNSNQINAQMEVYISQCNTIIQFINNSTLTFNNILYQQVINELNNSISQINNFATSLLNYNQSLLLYYKVPNSMSMIEAMYNNNINLDTWKIQIQLNNNIDDYNNIIQNTNLTFYKV